MDRQTRAEVWKVINKIVGEANSVSLLTSDHADSLSESLRPHLENVMTSCYERETLLVAEYPCEKHQCEEPDDSSESEPQEESEDLYGDFEEIKDSIPGFLEPGNSESGLRLLRTPAKVLNKAPLCFNLAAQPAKKKTKIVATNPTFEALEKLSHVLISNQKFLHDCQLLKDQH